MPFDPRKLLEFCKHLCKGVVFGHQETNARNTISRAYYSAFLHTREYLKENTPVTLTGKGFDHELVYKALKQHVDRTLGSYLLTLREDRNAADYNLENPATFTTENGTQRSLYFDINDQMESIRLADKIVTRLARA